MGGSRHLKATDDLDPNRGLPGRPKPPSYTRGMKLNRAENVNTAEVAGLGLVGGWLTARTTGVRPLGGTVLAAAGCWAGRTWLAKSGPTIAGLLGATYLAAFGASHGLAKKIGAWPAVITVTAATCTACHFLCDTKA